MKEKPKRVRGSQNPVRDQWFARWRDDGLSLRKIAQRHQELTGQSISHERVRQVLRYFPSSEA
ncbi:MAG TPA: hypothetical protein VLK82_12480 [Candidatus Tectomicrobia bacterium]|nr:hypothetical protein [Candidatus Tectomicrobia bacterium]